jgi:hypothetical protein
VQDIFHLSSISTLYFSPLCSLPREADLQHGITLWLPSFLFLIVLGQGEERTGGQWAERETCSLQECCTGLSSYQKSQTPSRWPSSNIPLSVGSLYLEPLPIITVSLGVVKEALLLASPGVLHSPLCFPIPCLGHTF